jgi:dihydroneopterin aldolase
VTIELAGLELYGYHGALPEERERGQRFLVDLRLDPLGEQAAATDSIDDAVDYRDVVALVQEVFQARSYQLLEALTAALADALLERLPLTRVEVRVRKPDVRLAAPVEHAAVLVERSR